MYTKEFILDEVNAIREEIGHDKVNISEVAYRVGFSTPSYFSNSFRSYFGLSPKEFVAKYSDVTDRETLDKLFE